MKKRCRKPESEIEVGRRLGFAFLPVLIAHKEGSGVACFVYRFIYVVLRDTWSGCSRNIVENRLY